MPTTPQTAETVKDANLLIRITTHDRDRLRNAARLDGAASMSDFIRNAALAAAARVERQMYLPFDAGGQG